MNSTANTPTLPVDAQIELSAIEGLQVTGVAENTSTLDSKNSPAAKVTVHEPVKYKMVARRQLQKPVLEFYHRIFPIYRGLTSRIVADIEKYQLTEATSKIYDEIVIAAEEPDERELEILQAKERVRYRHIIIREKWTNHFGDQGERYGPSVFTPCSRLESLWYKCDLSSEKMRLIRNNFAHNYQAINETADFKWLYEKYAIASPAMKALTKKLQEALDDPQNWFESEQQLPSELEDLLGPEYAKDTPETEASWAAKLLEYEERQKMMIDEAEEENEEKEEEEGTGTSEDEEGEGEGEAEPEPAMEDEAQGEDPEEVTEDQPPKSRANMNRTLSQVMEFALRAKPIRRVANAVGQQLWEMQGDMDPDDWIATGVHYHQAPEQVPNQALDWDETSNDGSARANSEAIPAAEGADPQATPAAEGGWPEEAGW